MDCADHFHSPPVTMTTTTATRLHWHPLPLAKVGVRDDAPPPTDGPGQLPRKIRTKSVATVVQEAWLASIATTRSVADSVGAIPWCGYSENGPADVESSRSRRRALRAVGAGYQTNGAANAIETNPRVHHRQSLLEVDYS